MSSFGSGLPRVTVEVARQGVCVVRALDPLQTVFLSFVSLRFLPAVFDMI